jgi:ABC-type Fe3+/spermidine/putrescine transport system ATPase subunit
MAPLGEAVHRGDQPRADALARRALKLERELELLDGEASRLTAEAREDIANERATIQPTRSFMSVPAEPDRR